MAEIETDTVLVGLGETKATVGNLRNYAAMVTLIREEMALFYRPRPACYHRDGRANSKSATVGQKYAGVDTSSWSSTSRPPRPSA
jgi:hypothetical protein